MFSITQIVMSFQNKICLIFLYYSTSESLKHLLQNIFRLMPEEVLTNSDSKVKHQMILFSNTPSMKISEASSADDVKHLACWVCN